MHYYKQDNRYIASTIPFVIDGIEITEEEYREHAPICPLADAEEDFDD